MVEVTVKGTVPLNPRARVLAMEAAAEAICREIDEDPAEGAMMLLTAAVHVAMRHARDPSDIENIMADALGNAIIAARGFFPNALREGGNG
jgi:hypothetical protein